MSESPFEVAAGQAAQSAFMSLRLLISIGTVLRSSVEKEAAAADPDRAEKVRRLRAMEPELSPQEISDRYAAMVRETFRPELAEALVNAEQWPQMAAELHQLDRAGVDVRSFLGDASRTAERIMREMAPTTAERWERTVRSHLPTETAEALVSAEEWPQLAEQMQQMQDAGLNVPGVLQDVARNGSTMQEAMRSAWQKTSERVGRLESEAAPAPARSRQTGPAPVNPRRGTRQDRRSRNPLAPDGRAAAFAETGMGRAKQERYARLAAEVISDQHVAGLLVVSTQWPEIAVQMRELEARSIDVGPRLAQIGQELGRQAATGQPVNVAAAAATVLGRPVSSKQRNARPAAEVTKPAPATEPKATTGAPPKAEKKAVTEEPKAEKKAEAKSVEPRKEAVYRWTVSASHSAEAPQQRETVATGEFRVGAGASEKRTAEKEASSVLRDHLRVDRPREWNAGFVITAVGPNGWKEAVSVSGGTVYDQYAKGIGTPAATATQTKATTAGPGRAAAAAAANAGSCTVAGPPTKASEPAATATPGPRPANTARQDHNHSRSR